MIRSVHCLVLIIIACFAGVSCTSKSVNRDVLYVSLSGNDSWSGKLPEPNQGKTDGPFATLKQARDTIRTLKKSGNFPKSGITVSIRGGVYPVTETFILSSEDSGTETSPVIWQAFPGEEVRLTGGKTVSGFEPVKDPAVLERFAISCRDSILQIDLKAQGVADFGEMRQSGFGMSSVLTALEVYFKGERMTLARYPNDGWLTITDVPQNGTLAYEGCKPHRIDGLYVGRHYGRFTYESDRPAAWKNFDDIWMFGYFSWDWADLYQKIAKIDVHKKTLYPQEPFHCYGYRKGQRFYFLNVLEELDSPGEWYLNRTSGILYLWPPSSINEGDVVVTVLDKPMISLEETSYLTVKRLVFEYSRVGAIQAKGGSDSKIAGCTLRRLGNGTAVIVDGGVRNGVTGCDVYDVGGAGIIVNGGDRKTLTPAGNYATNNHVFNYSRINRTYQSAVGVNGVGNLLAHNYVHDAPHKAFDFSGNENICEFNEVCDTAKETGDVGTIHPWYDWTQRGNVIRYNYFHHLHGPGLVGAFSVYLDDNTSGWTLYGNIFYLPGSTVFVGSGKDNTFENNIFVNCEPCFRIDSRGHSIKGYETDYNKEYYKPLIEKLEAMNYKEPPYSVKYPELLTYPDGDLTVPRGNKILTNVVYGGRFIDTYPYVELSVLTVKNNLISAPELIKQILPSDKYNNSKNFNLSTPQDKAMVDRLEKDGNMVITGDPGFVDVQGGNFQLKDDSPAYKLGFKRIPIEQIGLFIDEYRSSLPEKK